MYISEKVKGIYEEKEVKYWVCECVCGGVFGGIVVGIEIRKWKCFKF